jgi:hypothetical protein
MYVADLEVDGKCMYHAEMTGVDIELEDAVRSLIIVIHRNLVLG